MPAMTIKHTGASKLNFQYTSQSPRKPVALSKSTKSQNFTISNLIFKFRSKSDNLQNNFFNLDVRCLSESIILKLQIDLRRLHNPPVEILFERAHSNCYSKTPYSKNSPDDNYSSLFDEFRQVHTFYSIIM